MASYKGGYHDYIKNLILALACKWVSHADPF
jgi:hypothetical protein